MQICAELRLEVPKVRDPIKLSLASFCLEASGLATWRGGRCTNQGRLRSRVNQTAQRWDHKLKQAQQKEILIFTLCSLYLGLQLKRMVQVNFKIKAWNSFRFVLCNQVQVGPVNKAEPSAVEGVVVSTAVTHFPVKRPCNQQKTITASLQLSEHSIPASAHFLITY